MNKKGFTLIELLISVVILGTIITLVVTVINGISSSIKNKQRNNIISRIEALAANYAYDTGETLIYVDDLIKNGYYSLNEESDNLIDPTNNDILNCYMVEMTKDGSYYTAKFIEGSKSEENGICSTANLILAKLNLNIVTSNYKGDINNWIGGKTIALNVTADKKIDCVKNECRWTRNDIEVNRGSSTLNLGDVTGEYNYTFYYTYTGVTVNKAINLKIDNAVPTCEISSTLAKVNAENPATLSAISRDNNEGNVYYSWDNNGSYGNQNEASTKEINSRGVYTLYVKDGVDNETSCNVVINAINELKFMYTGKFKVNDVEYTNQSFELESGDWKIYFLTSGILTLAELTSNVDIFLVGGGGGGGHVLNWYGGGFWCNGASGGGGGYTITYSNIELAKSVYDVEIGIGGIGATSQSNSTSDNSGNGGDGNPSRIKLSSERNWQYTVVGGNGGWGKWGLGGANGGSGGGSGGLIEHYHGGNGGSDGGNGTGYNCSATGTGGHVCRGQGSTTREFGETNGTLYSGGGAGGGNSDNMEGSGRNGNAGAGGGANIGTSARDNTGGGGGGGSCTGRESGGNGGSGIVVMRNHR